MITKNTYMIQGKTQVHMKLDLFNILTKIIYSIKFISYKNIIIQTHKHINYIRQIFLKQNIYPPSRGRVNI